MIINRKIIPNFFTGISFFLGLSVILVVTNSETNGLIIPWLSKNPFTLSAWIILWSVNIDKVDGFTARLMKASSDFGAQFDSLADLLAFGIAPSLLVFYYTLSTNPIWFNNHKVLMFLALILYSICTAMRLARFNSEDMNKLNRSFFTGLPSTVAGGIVALSVILFDKYLLKYEVSYLMNLLPGLLIICGIGMVSSILLPKLRPYRNKTLNFLQIIIILFGYIFSFSMIFPEYLFSVILVYSVFGFGYGFIFKAEICKNNSE